ncbi:glucose-6-phosphate isomerase [Thalassotalea insulae]|uniref:Glucose-6-phosphate isomerase n=1 Tax=Thalassotalea insulae TaxID=2056778 RepID=A0ABQ6GSY5_9GAMM|nr:glucose-6-phosphate isomerase [Thalassotalea insulae]
MGNSMTALCALAKDAKARTIETLFDDSKRAVNFSVDAAGIFLDYAKQNLVQSERDDLCHWAKTQGLDQYIEKMFSGERINQTENRAVLHPLLRAPEKEKKAVLGTQAAEVIATEQKMSQLVNDISHGQYCTVNGQKFTDVLAIGIGGSYYGIKLGISALKPYHTTGLNVHVLANVDGDAVAEKLALLSAETTLVVVISKTFTTQETMLNAVAVKQWMLTHVAQPNIIARHWFAVSTNITAVTQFGITKDNILPMWDWVGGRFSLWSAVGFPLALAIGEQGFAQLKRGAYLMDQHFRQAPFDQNMPIVMALTGLWNRNALGYSSLAILPYNHALRALPGYLQQTDMESNGKSVSLQGEKLGWHTAPIVFGQEGTNSQHAFMQLMHQSEEIIPTDFIVCAQGHHDYSKHQQVLVANCLAQSEALMRGKTFAQAKAELMANGKSEQQAEALALHKVMKGNTPSNTLVLKQLTPKTLGALLALYEHKIFVQGVLWQLNSFDQWGVELGKELGAQILRAMNDNLSDDLSSSTLSLIKRIKQLSDK